MQASCTGMAAARQRAPDAAPLRQTKPQTDAFFIENLPISPPFLPSLFLFRFCDFVALPEMVRSTVRFAAKLVRCLAPRKMCYSLLSFTKARESTHGNYLGFLLVYTVSLSA